MKTKKTIQTCAIALSIMALAAITSSAAFGQEKEDVRQPEPSLHSSPKTLVGVWEQVDAPLEFDCSTYKPIPGTPLIRILSAFNEGGTGWAEDTAPAEGPYRSTGAAVWRRTGLRQYRYMNTHYSFLPDNTFIFVVKVTANVTLSPDGNSYVEKGRFDLNTPDGTTVYTGCFTGTANRLLI